MVERGVELQRRAGDGLALAFLTANGLSEHIVLRVLAGAAFRRKDWTRNDIGFSSDSAIAGAMIVSEYRGFSVSILCEPQDAQRPAAYVGVALLSCCARNANIDTVKRLRMRHALICDQSFTSFDQACAALVADARGYIDLFHEQHRRAEAFELPRAEPADRRRVTRLPT